MGLALELHRAGWLPEIWDRDKGKCHLCGREPYLHELCFDHLIPVSYGGLGVPWNLRVAHRSCNVRRGSGRTPAQLIMPIMELTGNPDDRRFLFEYWGSLAQPTNVTGRGFGSGKGRQRQYTANAQCQAAYRQRHP